MKTLMLLRHAKSGWGEPSLSDRERRLEMRGEHDAQKMGRRLSQARPQPERIITSPALRALATARIVAACIECPPESLVVDERLYGAGVSALIEIIVGLDDSLKSVMLVGHNPGLADLALHYSGSIGRMPTCAVATFAFDVRHWSEVARARPATTKFDSPKHPSA